MTVPSDFPSYWAGFELTAANYSGGAGGTFTNLAGGQDWAVNGATPSFTTNGAREGMTFAASSTESILGEMRAMREGTIVAVFSTTNAGTSHVVGGTNAAANTWSMSINAQRVQAFHINASSGYTAGTFTSGSPLVAACSWSPEDGKCYVNRNGGAVVSSAGGAIVPINYWNAGIGVHRTTYFTGWISAVYFFSRALHYRDNTGLQSLVTDLAATL